MLVSLLISVAVIVAAIALLQRHGQSLGMPLAYLISLATIHLPGGLAHLLNPGAIVGNLETAEGLSITCLCMLAFIAGMAWFEWQQGDLFEASAPADDFLRLDPRFWRFCATGGLLVGFVLAPLRLIPSLGPLIHNAGLIWISGVLLAIRFHSSQAGSRSALQLWVAVSLTNPFLSLFGQGFLGYGVSAITQVYSVMLVRSRRLIRSALILSIAFYLGLGVGVSYLASRSQIRDAVWGGASTSDRLDAIGSVASQVTLFDPNDLEQAKLLDLRLNQNFLVGAAALNIQAGQSQLLHGSTLVAAAAALIPRVLWPDKPAVGGSGSLVSDATGIVFAEGTSVGIGIVMESYINFGQAGSIGIFAALGAILRWLDNRAYRAEAAGDYRAYLASLLPALAMIQPGGSLAEITSSVICAWIAARLWFALWQRRFQRHEQAKAPYQSEPR